jgi:hypothetical protein
MWSLLVGLSTAAYTHAHIHKYTNTTRHTLTSMRTFHKVKADGFAALVPHSTNLLVVIVAAGSLWTSGRLLGLARIYMATSMLVQRISSSYKRTSG